jgi:Copper type II ascorbate-dependent monooxygenase, C-terminal domain
MPCAVKTIIDQKCGTCHGATASFGAPMPLATQANFQANSVYNPAQRVYTAVRTRINATTNPMPPPSSGTLSVAEKDALNYWLDQGAPMGRDTTCMTAGGSVPSNPNNIDTRGLECYKMVAFSDTGVGEFPIGAAMDAYYNFGFQAPWSGTVYGMVVRPVIDNAQALHHWLLYREPVIPGSISASIGQHGSGELIHGWAPGGIAMDFRRHGNVGFELPADTYSVEIHYNSSDPFATDASGVELCVQRNPPQNLATLSWLGYDQGGTLSYASGLCLEPATSWTGTCAPVSLEPIHIIYVTPHLHQSGRHMKAIINGLNGPRTLHDQPFDFAYQITYEKNEILQPGETITTTCTYSAPNCAGQATSQEMCYLFTYAWPKNALVDYGLEGTFMHGEGVCLGQ